MKMPTYDEMAKRLAEKAITEIEVEGKTIEQWIHEIVKLQNSNTNNWIKTVDKFPPEKEWIETKIDDGKIVRNQCRLMYFTGLWRMENGMHTYYIPTHWRHIENTKGIKCLRIGKQTETAEGVEEKVIAVSRVQQTKEEQKDL